MAQSPDEHQPSCARALVWLDSPSLIIVAAALAMAGVRMPEAEAVLDDVYRQVDRQFPDDAGTLQLLTPRRPD